MTIAMRFGVLLLSATIGLGALELGSGLPIPGARNLSSTAQAEVGRPLTPVSVAGVARRSARRR
jgi:hypothetical protein